jgi:hypothetical protein
MNVYTDLGKLCATGVCFLFVIIQALNNIASCASGVCKLK